MKGRNTEYCYPHYYNEVFSKFPSVAAVIRVFYGGSVGNGYTNSQVYLKLLSYTVVRSVKVPDPNLVPMIEIAK